jgi:transcriptional regulator with XRE-family HTH domain
MNETLRQALFRAGLSEDAIAARLGVDPKTVRRWLEGRLPYPRLRWELACLLATDPGELWPELGAAGGAVGRSAEVVAIYPHVSSVPAELWRELLGSAAEEIGILAYDGIPIASDARLVALLRSRAVAGVRVRIALSDHEQPGQDVAGLAAGIREVLGSLRAVLEAPSAEIRLYRVIPYNSLLLADEDILVSQRLYGVAADEAPVLHVRGDASDDLAGSYRDSFEGIWASSRVLAIP